MRKIICKSCGVSFNISSNSREDIVCPQCFFLIEKWIPPSLPIVTLADKLKNKDHLIQMPQIPGLEPNEDSRIKCSKCESDEQVFSVNGILKCKKCYAKEIAKIVRFQSIIILIFAITAWYLFRYLGVV
jgi:protein-arginine kinase activator protein McsA